MWTAAQTAAFLNAIRRHRLYAAYHVIALRGLHRGQACGLRWRDLDLHTGTAVIGGQLQECDGHLTSFVVVRRPARANRALVQARHPGAD